MLPQGKAILLAFQKLHGDLPAGWMTFIKRSDEGLHLDDLMLSAYVALCTKSQAVQQLLEDFFHPDQYGGKNGGHCPVISAEQDDASVTSTISQRPTPCSLGFSGITFHDLISQLMKSHHCKTIAHNSDLFPALFEMSVGSFIFQNSNYFIKC